MKALRYIFLLGSVGSLLTFSNCGGGSTPPEPLADQQFTKLSKTWTVTNVTLGGAPRTDEYLTGVTNTDPGPMKLTISGTKGTSSTYAYSVSGRPALSPWPKGGGTNNLGKWTFGSDPTKTIIRDSGTDQLEMGYTIDGSTLTISFYFDGTSGKYTNPRAEVVTGNWVFTFKSN